MILSQKVLKSFCRITNKCAFGWFENSKVWARDRWNGGLVSCSAAISLVIKKEN